MRVRLAPLLGWAALGVGAAAAALALHPQAAVAYPNGVPAFITDVAPYCAGCHSSRSRQQVREMSLAHQEAVYFENRHYGPLLRGEGPYAAISEEDRRSILQDVKQVDENTSLTVTAPRQAKPGEIIEVTVHTRGGGGPVIGVALLDADYRYQARPLPSSGWYVNSAPRILGPDGKPQADWLSRRAAGLKDNLSFVTVSGISCDLATKSFAECTITWQVRAPREPGGYPIVACLFYGTEKAAARGWKELPNGDRIPVGGRDAPSGRLLFSVPYTVSVR